MPFAPPRSLSPSKVASFTSCPLAFRLSIIDRLPEAPSVPAVKGTGVHAALERLFSHCGRGERTRGVALGCLDEAMTAIGDDPEFVALGLDDAGRRAMADEAAILVGNYFELEDPNEVSPVGIEMGLEADIGDLRLRGIIDRLDRRPDGELVVVDYKTGRAPSARYEQARLSGVHIYALLVERVLGRFPAEVRLLHLRDPVVITATPSEQTVRGQRQRTSAVWSAIGRACEQEEFRPKPGPLCRFCSFRSMCPAFGGVPPELVAS